MGKEATNNKEFEQGFACACATLLRMHKEDSMVMDMLRTCFRSFNHLAGCGADPFDLNPLLRLWKRETGT